MSSGLLIGVCIPWHCLEEALDFKGQSCLIHCWSHVLYCLSFVMMEVLVEQLEFFCFVCFFFALHFINFCFPHHWPPLQTSVPLLPASMGPLASTAQHHMFAIVPMGTMGKCVIFQVRRQRRSEKEESEVGFISRQGDVVYHKNIQQGEGR